VVNSLIFVGPFAIYGNEPKMLPHTCTQLLWSVIMLLAFRLCLLMLSAIFIYFTDKAAISQAAEEFGESPLLDHKVDHFKKV